MDITCIVCNRASAVAHGTKDGYRLVRCVQCGTVFVHPMPDMVEHIYGAEYFVRGGSDSKFGYADYEEDKKPLLGTLDVLLDSYEKQLSGRNIYDVGAATGFFLDIAKRRGWMTFGCELSDFARDIATQKGHHMEKYIGGAHADAIDCVTMWDVLEHVPNPAHMVQQVHSLLRSGGLIAINTVQVDSVWARLLGRRWQLMIPPEHVCFFSKKGLLLMLEANGFCVVSVGRMPKSFTLSYIFTIGARWIHSSLLARLAHRIDGTWIGNIRLPLDVRDNIYVVAKKIPTA